MNRLSERGGSGFPVLLRERGFTIIELLIAMVTAALVATAGFALFSASNKSYQIQESVGEAQQNARVGIDRISRDLRTTGFGLPLEMPDGGLVIDGTAFTGPLKIEDSSTGPDAITILGIGHKVGELAGAQAQGQDYICYTYTTVEEKMFDPNNGNNVYEKRKYINVDGVFFAELSTVVYAGAGTCPAGSDLLPLGSPSAVTRAMPFGSVYVIQAVKYEIVTDLDGCSDDHPCLSSKDYTALRGSGRQLLAEDITDIQFAFGYDKVKPRDGKLDDQNLDGQYTAADFVNELPSLVKTKYVVAVRVNVVAQSGYADKDQTFTPPTVENHTAGTSRYRSRVLTKVVKLRNPL